MRTAHLAHDRLTDGNGQRATLCGEPWEDWQAAMPTDAEIGFDDLAPDVRRAVRQSDAVRRGERVRQCQACFNLVTGRRP